LILYDIADGISRTITSAQESVEELLFEPVIRLGVTGLSRSGKTVFITSLVANLLDRGRMPQLKAAQEGRILSVYLQPQPDDDIPRFDFETHMTALQGRNPEWPASTRSISQLRLSIRVQPSGILSSVTGPRTIHLDIVDYPGEWLLDLPLLNQSYGEWAKEALETARAPARARQAEVWLAQIEDCDPTADLDEPTAKSQAAQFTSYLRQCREDGFSACAPGRFLMPGDLEGSPALTFAPLPEPPKKPGSKSLWRAFERRFESYKRIVVKPFFRNHFSRIDRQIVLVDTLGAIHAGPRAVDDLRHAMADILQSFRPGKNSWLSSILGKRVDRILFATTKADHLHQTQHAQLTAIMDALVKDARTRASHSGADTSALAIASLRATVEDTLSHEGQDLHCVRGTLLDTGKAAALYAGTLPDDPGHLLAPAGKGAASWLDHDFNVMKFAPPVLNMKPGEGPPHIRLDKATEFLIGDRLR